MPEKLKNIFFSELFLNDLSSSLRKVYPKFEKFDFVKSVINKDWKKKELKEKIKYL